MTSHQSTPADLGFAAPAIERDIDPHIALHVDLLEEDLLEQEPLEQEPLEQEPLEERALELTPFVPPSEPLRAEPAYLDSSVVEELTLRLPTSDLVKIIKGALECGRRNLPFTESDLLRTMTFGSSAVPVRQPTRQTRSSRS
jgi:hypothetical protein